ncbi:hypothetical protein QWZ16_17570 [Vibrio ostreicida]|uniref:Uncharacterized protein n=2 Tax=Vibrio ostreicida TaxID=526588 RepID=A0ABT8BSD2_9VIBR|nr:hypothetical protein [Vibrio ostreicida]MDN3609843.1 hypothetical protein [Vibrio ostreicida]MDN3611412.1 hypothetical protein [Vibrio ostreicida]
MKNILSLIRRMVSHTTWASIESKPFSIGIKFGNQWGNGKALTSIAAHQIKKRLAQHRRIQIAIPSFHYKKEVSL